MTEPSLCRRRIIAFDMDGTLIADRLIFRLADRFGFKAKLEDILAMRVPEYEKTRRIARLLKGITASELLHTLEQIPLSEGAESVARQLKQRGHILAIISDSYTLATEHLKRELGFDWTIANELVIRDGEITGEVKMPLNWLRGRNHCLKHSVCKLNSLIKLSEQMKVPLQRCVAIGDNIADICMLWEAGMGIAFNPKSQMVERSADIMVTEDLGKLLGIIEG